MTILAIRTHQKGEQPATIEAENNDPETTRLSVIPLEGGSMLSGIPNQLRPLWGSFPFSLSF